ncbi:MAG: patatin-like phospholipase family protein [Syntrophaceae bacterium]|jgi:NTE family protein|nr:patatin-like phospholipase family protein [Syntrophaceae bacterium]
MSESENKKIITALSLQGGGALGAYEYGVLKALFSVRGKNFFPKVVSGVSIGAINAAILVGAKEDPLATLDKLWRERFCVTWPMYSWLPSFAFFPPGVPRPLADISEQNLSVLGNPGMYRLKQEFLSAPFFAPSQTSSIYDTDLLKETLTEFVDPDKLNQPEKTRLIVTAVNVRTGEYAKFDNSKTTLTLDHIIASGSFPVTFPMTKIDGDYYWDGGIFLNMPLGVAVNALEQVEPDNPDIEREVIMIALHRMSGALPRTLADASERFYNLLFSGKFATDSKLFNKYGTFVDLMQKIDKSLPADSPIRDHEGYKDLIRHRKIDRALVIGETGAGAFGSGSDFSKKTLNRRIEDGFNDAMAYFTSDREKGLA